MRRRSIGCEAVVLVTVLAGCGARSELLVPDAAADPAPWVGDYAGPLADRVVASDDGGQVDTDAQQVLRVRVADEGLLAVTLEATSVGGVARPLSYDLVADGGLGDGGLCTFLARPLPGHAPLLPGHHCGGPSGDVFFDSEYTAGDFDLAGDQLTFVYDAFTLVHLPGGGTTEATHHGVFVGTRR